MRKNKRTNADVQPQEVAAAQTIADKTSACSEHGSVRVGKGSENRRKTEIKLVDSVVNVTNIDSSNKECGKVVASPLADIMAKNKDSEKNEASYSVFAIIGLITGVCVILKLLKGRKTADIKK